MLAVNYSTMRNQLKYYCDKVSDEGETIIVTRKDDKNVVMMSLQDWNEQQKALRNAQYLEKLYRAAQQAERGETIKKTLSELEAMVDG